MIEKSTTMQLYHKSTQPELTNNINFVLILSIESSKFLNSWLVSNIRISITDFDDFFTGEETFT